MKHLLSGMLCLLLAGPALASGPSVRERVEESMVVTGTITVAPDGTVGGYTLDRPERIEPIAAQVIGKNIPRWAFEPVLHEGKPAAAKAKMNLRLVAKPLGDGKFAVSISSAYFGEADSSMKRDMSARPLYPMRAIYARVEGTVYLMLSIDRTGKVNDAVAEQVNLRVIASDMVLQRWRKLFAESSVAAGRRWTFAPAAADDAEPYRVVRVPITYQLHRMGALVSDTYGQWVGYVPGPIEPAPWFDTDKMLTAGHDALPEDGGIYGKPSLSLRTPLDRS
jgi:hypothetical protein